MRRGGSKVREAETWLTQAESDLEAARLSGRSGYHDWACFQSQQAGEKALKAMLLFFGRTGVSSHSLFELLNLAAQDRPELEGLRAATKSLDNHYLAARYPDSLPGNVAPIRRYSEEDSSACIATCESILTASRSIVRGSRRSPES